MQQKTFYQDMDMWMLLWINNVINTGTTHCYPRIPECWDNRSNNDKFVKRILAATEHITDTVLGDANAEDEG